MFRIILMDFWPVFVPTAFYLLWLTRARKRGTAGEHAVRLTRGPLFWTLLSSVLVLIACFLLLGLSQKANRDHPVTPHHLEDGVLIQDSQ